MLNNASLLKFHELQKKDELTIERLSSLNATTIKRIIRVTRAMPVGSSGLITAVDVAANVVLMAPNESPFTAFPVRPASSTSGHSWVVRMQMVSRRCLPRMTSRRNSFRRRWRWLNPGPHRSTR